MIAYVSERVVEKIDDTALTGVPIPNPGTLTAGGRDDANPAAALDQLVEATMAGRALTSGLPMQVQDLLKRRVAEAYRERRLADSQGAISRIDLSRSQKLIAMSAPLISEMATALRRSAETLEVTSSISGGPFLFLDRGMAQEIETAIVDPDITPILGDIAQFNWGKLKIEGGAKTVSFSIPYDILPTIRQNLIDNMKRDLVYLQTYFVRDRSGEVIRLIVVGILPTPSA